jgi:hypothetical protein
MFALTTAIFRDCRSATILCGTAGREWEKLLGGDRLHRAA